MEPSAEQIKALHLERMARARKMSPAQKLVAGPQLFEIALEAMRAGIRLQFPQAQNSEIDALLRQRLKRMRDKDERAFHGIA